jgi:diguanylate cyclase (GGDEF)-like protein/PAS domain S-box-containing protein
MKQWYPHTVYENEEDRQAARILSILIWASWTAYLFVIFVGLFYNDWKLIAAALAGSVLQIVPLGLLQRRHLSASSFLFMLSVLGTVTVLATSGQGIRDLGIVAFPVIFIFASLALNRVFFGLCVGLTLVAIGWLVFGEANGWFVPQPYGKAVWVDFLIVAVILLVAALAVDLLTTNMRASLDRAQREITERKRAEEALRENEAIFKSFLEHSPIYIFFKDKNIRTLRLSKNYEQMLGMPIQQALGKTMDELFRSDLARKMVADDLQILNEGKRVDVVEELNGRIYETTKFPILMDGKPQILAGLTIDITERKQAEAALQENEQREKTILESIQAGILLIDAEKHTIVDANPAATKMIGLPREQISGIVCHKHVCPVEIGRCPITDLGQSVDSSERVLLTANGGRLAILKTVAPVMIQGRRHLVESFIDITERKRAEEQLRYLGTHDILTGLYNRAFFEEELTRLNASREFPVSVIVADVDNMKITNDTQGHAAGDELLRRATSVLQSTFRAADVLARIGGDEFAILLPSTDSVTAEQLLSRVRAKLVAHNAQHPDLPVQLSLGAATAEQNKLVDAFKIADGRMYEDKHARKSGS